MGAAVDRRVVEVLLRQGLLRQQPVHRVLLVEDLGHDQLLVDQLGADGGGHQARVVQARELRLPAAGLAAVRRSVGKRGHRGGRGLLRGAARDRLLLGETQMVVVGAGRGEVRQAVHLCWLGRDENIRFRFTYIIQQRNTSSTYTHPRVKSKR